MKTTVKVKGSAFSTLRPGVSTLCEVAIGGWSTKVYASSEEQAKQSGIELLAEEKEFGPLLPLNKKFGGRS